MTVLDSGFHDVDTSVDSRFQKVSFLGFRIPRPGFWIPKSRILDSRFQIPKNRILDSTSKYVLDFRFHEQLLLGFQNLDYLTWGDTYITLKDRKPSSKLREHLVLTRNCKSGRLSWFGHEER